MPFFDVKYFRILKSYHSFCATNLMADQGINKMVQVNILDTSL